MKMRVIAGRPVIGADYWPTPTLRKMPPGWHLSDTLPDARRWHWWTDGDSWIGLFCVVLGVIACFVTIVESL